MRKVVVYIAASLDGFIAAPGDDLSFLDMVQSQNEDYGYSDFMQTVSTVIMGRRTYEWLMKQVPEFPHANLEHYIISGISTPIGKEKYYSGNVTELINTLRSQPGKNIFVDGGSVLINTLLKEHCIDQIIVSVIPVLLGNGIRLFESGNPVSGLKLVSAKSFPSGLVQLNYSVNR